MKKEEKIRFCSGVCAFFLTSLILKLLWNEICPSIFHLPEITYWQSVGLYMISNILFKESMVTKRHLGKIEKDLKEIHDHELRND